MRVETGSLFHSSLSEKIVSFFNRLGRQKEDGYRKRMKRKKSFAKEEIKWVANDFPFPEAILSCDSMIV
jgi:hypothetical protein